MSLKMKIDVPAVFASRHDNCALALSDLEDAARTTPSLTASMLDLRRRMWAIDRAAEEFGADLETLAAEHPKAFTVRATGQSTNAAARILELADSRTRWSADPATALGPVPPARKGHRTEHAVWAYPKARAKVATRIAGLAIQRDCLEASYWGLALALTQALHPEVPAGAAAALIASA